MKKFLVVLTLAFLFCPSGSEAVNIKDFTIKYGQVFKGKTRLDCEVNEISEGAVRYWSMIGPDSAGGAMVKDDEIGAGFFSREGACLAFVPLDSEEELQDVEFAPKGENFVIVRGSGIRPDMFCDVYVKGIKKAAELAMLRGSLIWIDPDRFIYTRIDDVRDGYARVLNGMRLSVSMYDASNQKESVLKESTGTQNFQLNEFENGQATITEEYVENEKDWGDEAEPKEREIKLPIPAR